MYVGWYVDVSVLYMCVYVKMCMVHVYMIYGMCVCECASFYVTLLSLHLVLETGLSVTLALAWWSARSASLNSPPLLAPQSAVVRSMCVSTSCL